MNIRIVNAEEKLITHLTGLGFQVHEIAMLKAVAKTIQEISERCCETGDYEKVSSSVMSHLSVVRSVIEDHFKDVRVEWNRDPRAFPIDIYNVEKKAINNSYKNCLSIY